MGTQRKEKRDRIYRVKESETIQKREEYKTSILVHANILFNLFLNDFLKYIRNFIIFQK